MRGKSQNRHPQFLRIDPGSEFNEWQPGCRIQFDIADICKGCRGWDGHHLDANICDAAEIGEVTKGQEQIWRKEPETGCPRGVVNVDSEELIAYVPDSAL